MLVLPVRSVDEKLLPDSASSVCGTYNNGKVKNYLNTATVDIRTECIDLMSQYDYNQIHTCMILAWLREESGPSSFNLAHGNVW